VAPFKDRPSKPILADGDYCELQETSMPPVVKSAEDCVRVMWRKEHRTYHISDPSGEDKDEEMDAAVVSLGGGLYAGQIETPEAEGKDRYQISLFVASGDAFAMLPLLDDEPLRRLAARHRKLTFANTRPPTEPGDFLSGRPWISAGSVKDIRTFLKEAAREGQREAKKDPDADELSVGVRDTGGTPDHPASAQQARNAKAIRKIAERLTPR
jgi:hypothetical protein